MLILRILDKSIANAYNTNAAKAAEWPRAIGMRKVRAPQGRMPVNGWWRRLQGKCNRNIPPVIRPVRVERCGKSAPAAWQLVRHVNPIRCKIEEDHGLLARLRYRLNGLATGRLDRWLFTTELGL